MTSSGGTFSILAALIILALVVAAVLWIIHELRGRRHREAADAFSALEILDQRLASGEIKTDQYEQLRRALTAARQQSPESRSTTR